MHTAEFVALQMAKRPEDRVIPDLVYMQSGRIYTITILKHLQKPRTASRVFGDGYLYEDARCFVDEHKRYYPNNVIPWSLVLSLR